jgi:hypothetical protein
MRRRREEEGIQLRKQKREQQLFKKRNVTAEEILQVPTFVVKTLYFGLGIPLFRHFVVKHSVFTTYCF